MALGINRRYLFRSKLSGANLLALGLRFCCFFLEPVQPVGEGIGHFLGIASRCFSPRRRIQIAYGQLDQPVPVSYSTPGMKKVLIPGDPENGNWNYSKEGRAFPLLDPVVKGFDGVGRRLG